MNPEVARRWILDEASKIGAVVPAFTVEDVRWALQHKPVTRILQHGMSIREGVKSQELMRAVLNALEVVGKQEREKATRILEERTRRLQKLTQLRSRVQELLSFIMESDEEGGHAGISPIPGRCEQQHHSMGATETHEFSQAQSDLQERASNIARDRATVLRQHNQKLQTAIQSLKGILYQLQHMQQQLQASIPADDSRTEAALKKLVKHALMLQDIHGSEEGFDLQRTPTMLSRLLEEEWNNINSVKGALLRYLSSGSTGIPAKPRGLIPQRQRVQHKGLRPGQAQMNVNGCQNDTLNDDSHLCTEELPHATSFCQKTAQTRKLQREADVLETELVQVLKKGHAPKFWAEKNSRAEMVTNHDHGPVQLKLFDLKTLVQASMMTGFSGPNPRNLAETWGQNPTSGTCSGKEVRTGADETTLLQVLVGTLPEYIEHTSPLQLSGQSMELAMKTARVKARRGVLSRLRAKLLQEIDGRMDEKAKLLAVKEHERGLDKVNSASIAEISIKMKLNHFCYRKLKAMAAVLQSEGHRASPLMALRYCSGATLQQLGSMMGLFKQEVLEVLDLKQALGVVQPLGIFKERTELGATRQTAAKGWIEASMEQDEAIFFEHSLGLTDGKTGALDPIFWWQGVEFLADCLQRSGQNGHLSMDHLAALSGVPGAFAKQAISTAESLARARSLHHSADIPGAVAPLYTNPRVLRDMESHRDTCTAVLHESSQAASELECSMEPLAREVECTAGLCESYQQRARQCASMLMEFCQQTAELKKVEIPRLKSLMYDWEKQPVLEALLQEKELTITE